jgi:hypothetical protein
MFCAVAIPACEAEVAAVATVATVLKPVPVASVFNVKVDPAKFPAVGCTNQDGNAVSVPTFQSHSLTLLPGYNGNPLLL